MLHLYVNEPVTDIEAWSIDSRTGFRCEPSWFTPEAIKCITDIDKNEYIGDGVSRSKYFGILAPQRLSGGTKILIYAMAHPNVVCPLFHCGSNCAPTLEEISKTKDLTFTFTGSHFIFTDTQPIHCMEHDTVVIGKDGYWNYLRSNPDLMDMLSLGVRFNYEGKEY